MNALKEFVNYENPNSLGSKFRRRRLQIFINYLNDIIAQCESEIRILDIGGTVNYWKNFPFKQYGSTNFHILIINIDIEESSNYSIFENCICELKWGDGCELSLYSDKSFDLVHSNSVIEHVGGWSKAKEMSDEMNRVASHIFLQTPNFYFPIEPHFLVPLYQFLPRPLGVFILRLVNKETLDESNLRDQEIRLLTKSELKFLFPGCSITPEKFLLMSKSFMIYK